VAKASDFIEDVHVRGASKPAVQAVLAGLDRVLEANTEPGRRYLGLDVLARCRIRPVADTTEEEGTTQPTIPALSA
jgi:hypothetical protein